MEYFLNHNNAIAEWKSLRLQKYSNNGVIFISCN